MQPRAQNANVIGAERHNSHDKPPRTFTPGRQCAEPNCGTRLSLYNDSNYCSLHTVKVSPRVRGKKVFWPWDEQAHSSRHSRGALRAERPTPAQAGSP